MNSKQIELKQRTPTPSLFCIFMQNKTKTVYLFIFRFFYISLLNNH